MKISGSHIGCQIPPLGLGTWRCKPKQVSGAITCAIENGYRHIDCAYLYSNEKDIGNALEVSLNSCRLTRENIFITSKLWSTFFRPELVEECCKQTLENLKLSYIDLYLLHSPMALQPGHGLFPSLGENGPLAFDSVPLISTWKAMEMLVDKGLVMSVGLSNFNRRQIEEIWHHSRIRPTNLQIEAHANFPNAELVAFAQSLGMSVTAYAPLGSPGGFRGKTCLLDQHWVCEIADAHGKTAAQVLLRYLLQRNMIVIPKSSRPEKIVENSKIFDFELTREEMRRMDNFGLNERQFKFKKFKDHPEYPFNDPF